MNLNQLKSDLEKAALRFKEDIAHLRTGRASPDMVNKIMVSCYGAKSPLDQVAAISIEDAKTIRIQPWDKTIISQIESGIRNSDIGIQPVVDKETLRVVMPELTSERRKQLIKILKDKLEEARISVKIKREEVWKEAQEKERDGDISNDDKFRLKDELQKLIDETNGKLDEIMEKKESEING